MNLVYRLASLAALFIVASSGVAQTPIDSLAFEYQAVTGIGLEKGVCRRDPSDVIRVGDLYYVYYTKVVQASVAPQNKRLYPSGYVGTIWYATSEDGLDWSERGEVLSLGAGGAWDSQAVFTPNILRQDGRYWMYYTGVQPTPGRTDGVFENNSRNDPAMIGVAVATTPDGPFERVHDRPVIATSDSPAAFDSYRADDACLLVRDGKTWLYYKGRSAAAGADGPRRTQMGVATASSAAGPFTKANSGRPVQDSGHEVQIWGRGNGVLSLVSATGPNGRTLQHSSDGLKFNVLLRDLKQIPNAPGLYRPELTGGAATDLPEWGIGMVHGKDPHLIRYECVWNQPASE